MTVKKIILSLPLAFTLVATSASASHIEQGATVCRNHKALLEVQNARASGDQQTIDWLFGGSACFAMPDNTPVRVLGQDDDGNRRIRTTKLRRNMDLWADSRNIGA